MASNANVFSLSRLLAPKSIAVVGGESAAMVISQCQKIGFEGDLFAVHPTRASMSGVQCVPSLADLHLVPDACFLGVSPQNTVASVAQLAACGAGGAVCYAAGFAEYSETGEQLQRQLVEQAANMPIVGPNCHGFINYLDGVALWPDHFGGGRTESGPALLVQSGNIGINVTFQQRALSFSYVIAMGNNAQLNVHDYIHALLDDSRVTAIGLHLEGISDVSAFTLAAIRAQKLGIPLVAIKSGSSALGAQLALSHTRSLANPDDLVGVMFARYGIARCASLPEFLETLKFVSLGGAILPRTGSVSTRPESEDRTTCDVPVARIASMSCSGGEASHLADIVGKSDVMFPKLSRSTALSISALLGDRVHVSNPLDYHTYAWGNLESLTATFTALLQERLDCALLILDYPPPDQHDVSLWLVAEQALCAASKVTGTRVVVVATLPENLPACARARLTELKVAPMQGLHECVQAIAHAHSIGLVQQKAHELSAIKRIEHIGGDIQVLNEHESKTALAKFGLAVPKAQVCSGADLEAAAEFVGFPLVMKALGANFVHKTELGAVRLGLSSVQQVKFHGHDLSIMSDELLLEAMISDAVAELLIGITYEEDFGQVLLLGTGGVQVELWRDSVQLLLPATRNQIKEALSLLNVYKLIEGFRGSSEGDLQATLDAIVAIVDYAMANAEQLEELEVNPLLVRPRSAAEPGLGAIAVDAVIRLREID